MHIFLSILIFFNLFLNYILSLTFENIYSDEECIDKIKYNFSNLKSNIDETFDILMKKRWVNCYLYFGDYYIKNKLNSNTFDSFYYNITKEIKNIYQEKQLNHYLPMIEYSQNHTNIFIHILNNMNFKFENFKVILNKYNLIITYVINNENSPYIQLFYNKINLFNPSKKNSLVIKEESDYNYIIYFEKEIVTFFWEYLDLPTDSHENIKIWFDMYQKYENKVKFNEYKEYVDSNLLIKNIDSYINDKIEEKKKRLEKIKKLEKKYIKHMNEEKNYYYMNFQKKKCLNILKEKQYFDWFYWLE